MLLSRRERARGKRLDGRCERHRHPEIGNGPNETFGASTIILGRLGRCEYVIDVPGTGGHGAHSYNERFINAATECAKIVGRLDGMRKEHKDEFEFASKEVVGGIGENTIYGSFYVNRVEAGDGSLSVPSGGRIFVDWTFTPNFTIDYGLKKLRDLIEEMYESGELEKVMVSGEFRKITVQPRPRPTPASNAFITPHDHPFTDFVRKAIAETVSFKNYNMGFSVADENVFARIRPDIPVLVVGPLGDDCHVADEWITIDSLLELEKVFTKFGESFGLYE
ncbi:MAG: hypothetical protein E3J72_09155 [Planctomycetota bacterium]|nr:MAG: hypothetical protein E3J72_09155 [Planctomycetota bacterium]